MTQRSNSAVVDRGRVAAVHADDYHLTRAGMPASRSAAIVLAVLLAMWSAFPLRAHNSDISSATVRVASQQLHLEVEVSAEAAMALLGIPMGTQGTPPNRDDLLPPLTKVAPGIFRFTLADTVLDPGEVRVAFREEDGVSFVLAYSQPAEPPDGTQLTCEALCLDTFGKFHRMSLTLLSSGGKVLRRDLLQDARKTAVLTLPREDG